MEKPEFIKRDGVIAEQKYVEWLADIKSRYRKSQIKAAVKVNSTLLEFYWSVGQDLVRLKAEERWGAGVVKQFAFDMRNAFPDETGFSYSNVKYMKRWYVFYYERITKSQQVVDEFRQQVGDQKGQRVVDLLEMPQNFGLVPWGQHIMIITKCETVDEALFYINKIAEEGWSRSRLEHELDSNLYGHQGTAITNFSRTLPQPQSELAQEILKDSYNFSFLDIKAKHDEKDLQEALEKNITRFLLELGKGFAYVGRQMELRMDEETSFFPDLIFYHIPQKRYVIIELKAVKFVPEFAGKLNFYVTAADKLLKGDGDNPSVGLVICRTAKKTIVEWSLQDIQKPLGVATYQIEQIVERTVKEFTLKKSQTEKKIYLCNHINNK